MRKFRDNDDEAPKVYTRRSGKSASRHELNPPKQTTSRTSRKSDTNARLSTLLEKTRKVGRAMQAKHEGEPLNYFNLSKLLSEFSTANVYIADKSGHLLGYNWLPEYTSKALSESFRNGVMPEEFVIRMNRCRDSEVHDEDAPLFDDEYEGEKPDKHLMYVPIIGASAERLGTIMLVRENVPFIVDDVLLAEYLGMLAGIEILNERAKVLEETARNRLSVQMAMRALSYSELESMKHIVKELEGCCSVDDSSNSVKKVRSGGSTSSVEMGAGRRDVGQQIRTERDSAIVSHNHSDSISSIGNKHNIIEGVAVASRVADRVGVTRSVIVNALRKLESAGLIVSRSLGMKGTYIKILNPLLLEYLAK